MADISDRRPSPEALLDLAEREKKGKLKIFLGASPGVGKTYAMLTAAQRLKREGKEVVVGLVETHGRSETAALLEGLEILPRRKMTHRGHELMEFDIDAALARSPDLIIIDELAHSNAPDSRHPKRYQDVEELIEAGISVWTALNIQHVESLADVVASITGIKIRELVPDMVIDGADDVVVVDISPDELIQRLKDGKVYLPENARRASENFLKPSNITALRDLALRKTAQRVDDQMVDYLRLQAIEGPWPTAERLLVCVGPDNLSENVVRTAARMASGLNASWIAVHISKATSEILDPERNRKVDEALALAARLGAETTRLSAADLASEILRLAREENITQIVIGRSATDLFKTLVGRSLPDEIIRKARGLAIHVVTSADPERRKRFRWRAPRLLEAVSAPIGVALATLVGVGARQILVLPNISLIYVTAVLFCAVVFGTWSAVFAAFLSFLAYNFFFIDPLYTFSVASPHEVLALMMFLLVATLTGSLTGRVREQRFAALSRVKQVQTLFDVSRKLSASPVIEDIVWVIATQLATILKGQSIVLLRRNNEIEIVAAMPPEDSLGTSEWAAARWANEHSEAAGWATTTLPNAHFQFRPPRTAKDIVGVAGFRSTGALLSQSEGQMIDALLDQAAIAVERTLLSGEAADATAMAERERLRSALLSSISHDLRTPLSSILGSVTTLRTLGPKLRSDTRDDLLANIEEETTRLSRFVSDLLDMTRLEGGAVDFKGSRVDIADAASGTVRRARITWPDRDIQLSLHATDGVVIGDTALFEQLLFNLLENAHKYAPPGTVTAVSVTRDRSNATITVDDAGIGIPQIELERIFEKFHRIKAGDGRPPGTGLGLAICKAITTAMGGTIKADSPGPSAKGSRFTINLPLAADV